MATKLACHRMVWCEGVLGACWWCESICRVGVGLAAHVVISAESFAISPLKSATSAAHAQFDNSSWIFYLGKAIFNMISQSKRKHPCENGMAGRLPWYSGSITHYPYWVSRDAPNNRVSIFNHGSREFWCACECARVWEILPRKTGVVDRDPHVCRRRLLVLASLPHRTLPRAGLCVCVCMCV